MNAAGWIIEVAAFLAAGGKLAAVLTVKVQHTAHLLGAK